MRQKKTFMKFSIFFIKLGEMNDSRLLLEEQTSRNAFLEKKQRKFDAELGLIQVTDLMQVKIFYLII